MSLPLPLAPGTVIGSNYIIGNLINSGGFGAVYQGVDTSEGNRPCAIKETYDVTPVARRQALMEASVLFTVRSKHLPEVYDALEANGRFYLIMQLIEGRDLLQVLRSRVANGRVGEQEPHRLSEGPCSEQEVLEWLLPIVDVLQDLHSRNPPILHRDIKPGNIILTPSQTAVLVDFGLTKLYDPTRSTQTMVKAVTEGFSPLEQYVGKTSPQSDLYSLAATMYLLLTNRLPPAAISRTVHDTLIAPRQLNPALSPKIERVLLKALAVRTEERYQSMREFALALKDRGFSSFADPTITAGVFAAPTMVTPPVTGSQPPLRITAPTSTPPPPPPPPRSYSGVARPPGGASYHTPGPQYSSHPTSASPPGYVMVPASALGPSRLLPTSSGQGCLWGMVQGVLAAILVAFTAKEANFTLAILMGFAFYVIAGFTTTWRGGGALRGAWAGFWAGIISTFMFWIVLGICFAIRIIQYIQLSRYRRYDIAYAAHLVVTHSALPQSQAGSSQSTWSNLLFYLGSGLAVALVLGWVGGLMGSSRYRASIAKKANVVSQPNVAKGKVP